MAAVKTIIWPTDFSDLSKNSISWAMRLAAFLDAEIHCVYALEEVTYAYPVATGAIVLPDMHALEQSSTEQLDVLVRELFGDQAERVIRIVVRGRPADEIVGYAEDTQALMIVISTHGYSGFKHMMMGSTTEAVLRQAKCPVLVIPDK